MKYKIDGSCLLVDGAARTANGLDGLSDGEILKLVNSGTGLQFENLNLLRTGYEIRSVQILGDPIYGQVAYELVPIAIGISPFIKRPLNHLDDLGRVADDGVGVVGRVNRPNLQTALPGRLKGDVLANPGAVDDIMVLGSLKDTRKYIGTKGHNVLDAGTWSVHVNDGWMLRGINEGRVFKLTTKPNISSLRATREVTRKGTIMRELTVYHRELKMLREAGYIRQGDFMIPGPYWKGF